MSRDERLQTLLREMEETLLWAKTYDIGNINMGVIERWLKLVRGIRS